jgi:hypothetical protein
MSTIVMPETVQPVAARNGAVIGVGYVGLTLRASPALLDHQPEFADSSLKQRAQLAEGNVSSAEPRFTQLAAEMLVAGTTSVRTEQGTRRRGQLRADHQRLIYSACQQSRCREPCVAPREVAASGHADTHPDQSRQNRLPISSRRS